MKNRLTQVHIRNFRAIAGPVDINLAPITILYGPNSAGKSAVYGVIDLVGRLCSHGDATFQDNEDLLRAMRNHDYTQTMTIGLSGKFYEFDYCRTNNSGQIAEFARTLEENLPRLAWYLFQRTQQMNQPHRENNPIDIRVDWSVNYLDERWDSGAGRLHETRRGPCAYPVEISINGALLATITRDTLKFNLIHPVIAIANKDLQDHSESLPSLIERLFGPDPEAIRMHENTLSVSLWHYFDNGFLDLQGGLPGNPTTADQILLLLARTVIRALIMVPLQYIASSALDFTHIGPVRKMPTDKDLTFLSASPDGDSFEIYADLSHSEWSWRDGGQAWKELADSRYNQSLITLVNDWLNAPQRLNLKHRICVSHSDVRKPGTDHCNQIAASGQRPASTVPDRITFINLHEDGLNEQVSVSNVGAGIPQLVPVLTAGFLKEQIFIEQPELHLHPSLQTEIADYFISRYNSAETSFVIESHSEFLALRLLRRIRETSVADIRHREFQLEPDQVAFYYFNPTTEGTNIVHLRVSAEGEFIDRWPRGFFAEREVELFGEDD
ncbi:AAA family ATPase [uncultured Thiodictyon sp.]|uniref:DUF3696 domain-containing protein n=1 Tax=uncultured Thiodictyon sp. TaxID=1846217 RepID=UPI0025DD13EE|nr:AAA family ATPase [uncultured Thiodictyon sp.]